jgi:hypothetical protein
LILRLVRLATRGLFRKILEIETESSADKIGNF